MYENLIQVTCKTISTPGIDDQRSHGCRHHVPDANGSPQDSDQARIAVQQPIGFGLLTRPERLRCAN